MGRTREKRVTTSIHVMQGSDVVAICARPVGAGVCGSEGDPIGARGDARPAGPTVVGLLTC